METIRITDMTLPACAALNGTSLSFKERLEIAKSLDRLRPDILELPALENRTSDALLMRTISTTVRNCGVSMPVGFTKEEADDAWAAVSRAAKPRLRLEIPLSTVQMEYLCRKKPAAVLAMAEELTAYCRSLCADVDFCAGDATRADPAFLREAIRTAIRCGATTVTVCDSAGTKLPAELADFLNALRADVPELGTVTLAVRCVNELRMAEACAVSAVGAGAREVKTALVGESYPSLPALAHILALRGDELGYRCDVNTMEMQRLQKQVSWIVRARQDASSPFEGSNRAKGEEGYTLSSHDGLDAVSKAAVHLGYDLSEEDLAKVYDAFRTASEKKDLSARELEAIIASVALQVPPTYTVKGFVINSGSQMRATAHIAMEKDGRELRGLCAGDGPIDACFLAIEQIAGTHYELDDFQIQAVTEGREAMGSAFVKLRSGSKLYSGSGISTDIIDAAIHAYVSALNKIAYEEAVQ
jgi:2-isopropylmalate synthase